MGQTELNCVLAVKAKHGNKAALDQLWSINQGLVQKIIKQYPATKSADTDDLQQCAWFGLLEAVRDFDPTRGAFTTVLVWRIRRYCLIALGNHRKYVEESVSLDIPLTDDADATTLGEMIEDDSLRSAAETLEEKELQRNISEAINRLRDDERVVIQALYYKCMTLQRTADMLSISITRVRQREAHALKVLRRDKVLCRWCCPDGVQFTL